MDSMRRANISVKPYQGAVRVSFSDAIIASSDRALIVIQPGSEPIYYLPLEDIYLDFMRRSETPPEVCPLGAASYWSVSAMGEAADDVMWTHETPDLGFETLRDHAAFDPMKVLVETTGLPDPASTV